MACCGVQVNLSVLKEQELPPAGHYKNLSTGFPFLDLGSKSIFLYTAYERNQETYTLEKHATFDWSGQGPISPYI